MGKKAKQVKYSFTNILTGSDLSFRRLALMEAKSEKSGPIVWLTGCVHGDEVGGIVIIQEIFKRLRKIPLLRGALYAFPLMNPIGFESTTRSVTLSEEDLNRAFPGAKSGTLAERMADKIFSSIVETKPTVVLDIHNDWLNAIPYMLIDPNPGPKHKEAYEKTKLYSTKLGFLILNEKEEEEDIAELKKTLSGSLLLHDVPAITLEIGGASTVSSIAKESDVQDGVKAIWDLLTYFEMVNHISQEFNNKIPDAYKGKTLRYSHLPLASSSGIIRFLVKPGEVVNKGQPLTRIYNVFGKLQETLKAERESLVLGHSDFAKSYPGAEVISCAYL